MSKFKYEPYKGGVDKDRIAYDDQKAHGELTGTNGKGSVPRHDIRVFSEEYDKIDWSK